MNLSLDTDEQRAAPSRARLARARRGLRAPALKDPEFLTKELLEEKLILALPDIVDTGGRTVAKLERLETHNLILYPEYPRPSYADFVLDACETAGFRVPLRVWCMDLQTALSLVSVGEGVCIVPESVSSAPRKA